MSASKTQAGWQFQLITFRPPGYPPAHVAIFITNSVQPTLQRLVYFSDMRNLKGLYPPALLNELSDVMVRLVIAVHQEQLDVEWQLLSPEWSEVLVTGSPSSFDGPTPENIDTLVERFLTRR